MNAIPDQFPISLRAWPREEDAASALTSLISRINSERGSFRSITEESLREEIAKEDSNEMSDNMVDGVEEAADEPDRVKELATAKDAMITQLERAHHASLVALDFISLLLSKDTPIQASLSISKDLREAVGLGTLGVDKVKDSKVSQAQKQDIARTTRGWKIETINGSVDSILASATRLEHEIELETKYWEEITAVKEEGWAICRLPQEKHTLGVRYGFKEGSFRNRSLAALRRSADGSVFLDQGIKSTSPRRLRVRIETNGEITGQLREPPLSESPPIEEQILNARNAVFEEELWHEINREARTLGNLGVNYNGQDVRLQLTTSKSVILDLVMAGMSEDFKLVNCTTEDESLADVLSISLHLLLSYAHRQNQHRRSQPPPPISDRPITNPPYLLLRPIIAHFHHETVIQTLNHTIRSLSKALITAGLTTEPYTSSNAINFAQPPIGPPMPLAELAIATVVHRLEAEFQLPLTNSLSQSLTIRLRTTTQPFETAFLVTPSGPYSTVCRPPRNTTSVNEVITYTLWAAACAVATSFEQRSGAAPEDAATAWKRTHNPTTLRGAVGRAAQSRELSFAVVPTARDVALVARCAAVTGKGAQELLARTFTSAEGEAQGSMEQFVAEAERVSGVDDASREVTYGKDGEVETGTVVRVLD